MSKEYLEALEKVYYGSQGYGNCDENYKIVKQALNRLESIDNADPSEALYELKRIDYNITYLLSDCDTIEEVSMCLNSLRDNKSCEVIKQALLKAQEPKKYVDELKLVEKDRKALDLLMQELDCKDFADLRKYARCGYQTFRNAKGANYDNIIIDEAVIPSEALECLEKVYSRLPQWDLSRNVDQCNIIKQALLKQQEKKTYLKWEDLEFGKTTHKLKAKMNDSLYRIEWYIDGLGANVVSLYKYITKDYLVYCVCIKDNSHNFFNDLHLERVEE